MDMVFVIGSGHDESRCLKIVQREVEYLNEQGIKDIEIIQTSDLNVTECLGCEYCLPHQGECVLSDEMEMIYNLFRTVDKIVFVSPVYFSNIPSGLKRIIDRCQMFYNLKDKSTIVPKKFLAIHIGGAPAYPNQFKGFECTYDVLLPDLRAEMVDFVKISRSDTVDPLKDKDTLERVRSGINKLIND